MSQINTVCQMVVQYTVQKVTETCISLMLLNILYFRSNISLQVKVDKQIEKSSILWSPPNIATNEFACHKKIGEFLIKYYFLRWHESFVLGHLLCTMLASPKCQSSWLCAF